MESTLDRKINMNGERALNIGKNLVVEEIKEDLEAQTKFVYEMFIQPLVDHARTETYEEYIANESYNKYLFGCFNTGVKNQLLKHYNIKNHDDIWKKMPNNKDIFMKLFIDSEGKDILYFFYFSQIITRLEAENARLNRTNERLEMIMKMLKDPKLKSDEKKIKLEKIKTILKAKQMKLEESALKVIYNDPKDEFVQVKVRQYQKTIGEQ